MRAYHVLFDYDAAIFLVLGLLAAIVLMVARRRRLDRETAVDILLSTFLLFSGTVRFLLLFVRDLFFQDLYPQAQALADGGETVAQLAFAQLAVAVLCLFGLRGSVPVRIAATVPLAVVLVGTAAVWAVLAVTGGGPAWPAVDTVAALVAGLFGLLLLALDWANRSDAPDPLEPGGKPYTY